MDSFESVLSETALSRGLDLGFEAAGYRTKVAVEFDADAGATLRANTVGRWSKMIPILRKLRILIFFDVQNQSMSQKRPYTTKLEVICNLHFNKYL